MAPGSSFDGAFDAYEASARIRQLFTEVFDPELPTDVEPFSFVPLRGLQRAAQLLGVQPGEVVVDLGCGRGGGGLWIARHTGSRLIGVDLSTVAISQAQRRQSLFVEPGRAEHRVGDLAHTGLAEQLADGAICFDAFHCATDIAAAARETRRLLQPGAVVVITAWQARDLTDTRVPDRFRRDLPGALRSAGLELLVDEDHDDWHADQRRLYRVALDIPADEIGADYALISLRGEAERYERFSGRIRRFLLAARRPGCGETVTNEAATFDPLPASLWEMSGRGEPRRFSE